MKTGAYIRRHPYKALGAGLFLLVLLLLGGVAVFAAGLTADVIGKKAGGRLGRDVSIEGPVAIDWHWRTPRLRAEDVRIANVPGSAEPDMVRIGVLDARVAVWKLLFGKLELPELTLVRPRIVLERPDEDHANWRFPALSEANRVTEAALPDERGEVPVIGLLSIDDGRIIYRDAPRGLDLDLTLDTAQAQEGGRRFQATGKGTLQKQPFSVRAEGGSLEMLRDTGKKFPLALDLRMGATNVELKGTFGDPIRLEGIDADLRFSGDNMADLFYLTGIPLPPTPPYDLKGRLGRKEEVWTYDKFSGKVGDSDIGGSLAYDLSGERGFLKASVFSKSLDIDDMGGLIGLPPATERGETASPEQKAESRQKKASPRLLPDVPVNLERLRAADMDVNFKAEKLVAPDWPFRGMDAHVNLRQGLLKLDPFHFTLADGTGSGSIVLDGRKDNPPAQLDLNLRNLSLGRFFDNTRFAEETQGRFGGHIDLAGSGRSLADILSGSDGRIVASMAGGRISLLLVEASDIDIAEAVPLLLGDDGSTRIRCGVGDFAVNDGVLRSRLFVLDTADTNLQGDVVIDLKRETIDARFDASPKDASPLALQSPITVSGRLKSPDIGIEAAETGARGAAAIALGAVLTPLAALLPFVELGVGEDSDCGELMAQARAAVAEPAAGSR